MSTLYLPKWGREYIDWPDFAGTPDVAMEVSFDGAVTWTPIVWVASIPGLYVAGPDATSNPAGTAVLTETNSEALVRVTDNPEIVGRHGGRFRLTGA